MPGMLEGCDWNPITLPEGSHCEGGYTYNALLHKGPVQKYHVEPTQGRESSTPRYK